MPTIFDAIEFAARAHAGQYRKSTRIPYIVHPIAVARILSECGADDAVVIAGILHDVIEDTRVTPEELRTTFGDEVADLVRGTTEPPKSVPWEDRKRTALESLESARQGVLLIELADKLDSIRDISRELSRSGEVTWTRFNRGRDQQKWYYQSLAELFLRRVYDPCGAELAREFRDEVAAIFHR